MRRSVRRSASSGFATKPTADDIQSGDALNALLTDLSDPTISESTWRYAKVPLPGEPRNSPAHLSVRARAG